MGPRCVPSQWGLAVCWQRDRGCGHMCSSILARFFLIFEILARAWPGLTQGLCHVLYLAAAWEGGLRGTAFVHSALLSPTLRGATLPALMHAVDVPPLGCPIHARVNRSGEVQL